MLLERIFGRTKMSTLHTINGKPVDPTTAQAPTVKPVDATATTAGGRTHTAESGDVGNTGQHGELGTNGK
jgi:hypothetical protein